MRRRGRTTAREYVWEKVIDVLLLRTEFAAALQAVKVPEPGPSTRRPARKPPARKPPAPANTARG
jgi:hypothetical protein